MHTAHSAYQLHQEHETGSIQVGKKADVIVLDRDVERVASDRRIDDRGAAHHGGRRRRLSLERPVAGVAGALSRCPQPEPSAGALRQ